MHGSGSIDAHLADLIAATHRGMRLTLMSVPFIVSVLLLSARSIHFSWYGALYGVILLLGGVQLNRQRGVLLLLTPGEVRIWMRLASLALGASGAILLASSCWQLGVGLAVT